MSNVPTPTDVPDSWFKFIKEIAGLVALLVALVTGAISLTNLVINSLTNSHVNVIKSDVGAVQVKQVENSVKLDSAAKAAETSAIGAAKLETKIDKIDRTMEASPKGAPK